MERVRFEQINRIIQGSDTEVCGEEEAVGRIFQKSDDGKPIEDNIKVREIR